MPSGQISTEAATVRTYAKASSQALTLSELASVLGIAVLVGLAEYSGLLLSRPAGPMATIWPANGVLLGALLTARPRTWPTYVGLSVAASLAACLAAGLQPYFWSRFLLVNATEVIIALALVRRVLGDACDLSRPENLWWFAILAAVASPAAAVLVNGVAREVLQGAVSAPALLASFLAHALGIITVTPVILAARRGELLDLFRGGRSTIRSTAAVVIPTLITVGVFSQSQYPLLFAPLPPLVLSVYLGGFAGGTLALFITTLISIAFTVYGSGPAGLIAHGTSLERLIVVQTFATVAATLVLALAAVVAQRDRAMAQLSAAKDRLAALATTDDLTGLANRRQLDEDLERECKGAARSRSPISLLLIDADNFKAFNDHYGHPAGDQCLKAIAGVLLTKVRRLGDVRARYGGEEFAVLLPDTDRPGALWVAESLRAAIEGLGIEHPGNPAGVVTASFGVATAEGSVMELAGAEALVGAADEALYDAKRRGRNRVASLPVRAWDRRGGSALGANMARAASEG